MQCWLGLIHASGVGWKRSTSWRALAWAGCTPISRRSIWPVARLFPGFCGTLFQGLLQKIASVPTPDKTIDHGSLRRLVEAGAQVGAEVVGGTGGWGVVINYGRASQTLAATRGKPRTWRHFETLAGYLKELGIVEYRVNAAAFVPGAAAANADDKRSATTSARMKRAHQAAAHDAWFRAQVQASIDDPRPNVDDDVARKAFAAKRAALVKRTAGAKKTAH